MSDDKPPMPVQPPTTKIPESDILKGLLKNLEGLVRDGFAKTEERFDKTDANIEIVSNDLKNTKEELRLHKADVDLKFAAADRRADTNSERAKQPSEQDLDLQAKLAAEIIERKAVGVKVDALAVTLDENTRLTREVVSSIGKALKNPIVGKLAVAIIAALISWLVKGHL